MDQHIHRFHAIIGILYYGSISLLGIVGMLPWFAAQIFDPICGFIGLQGLQNMVDPPESRSVCALLSLPIMALVFHWIFYSSDRVFMRNTAYFRFLTGCIFIPLFVLVEVLPSGCMIFYLLDLIFASFTLLDFHIGILT